MILTNNSNMDWLRSGPCYGNSKQKHGFAEEQCSYIKITVNRKTCNPPTFKHGLSVCAPMILNPFPGLNFPPTAKAIMVE